MKLKFVWGALWLVIFVLAFAWRVQNLDAFGLSNDEGIHLMWGRLLTDGYPLYGEIYAVQSPLFIESVAMALRLAGDTVSVGRWAMLSGFGLLALSLSRLAWQTKKWPAAISALVLVGIAPLIFSFSRMVMAEVPATALAVLSLALLVVYVQRRSRGWLVASGFVLGLSFIFKMLNPFLVVPAGVLLAMYHTRQWDNREALAARVSLDKRWAAALLVDLAVWGILALLPVAAIFLIYNTAATFDQLVAFRGDLRAAIPGSWLETRHHFRLFFSANWGFLLLAFGGIMSSIFNKPTRADKAGEPNRPGLAASLTFIWIVWLAAGVVMLLWHTPLFVHHFIVLLPPLILLGAGFISDVFRIWRLKINTPVVRTLFALILVAALFSLPSIVKANQHVVSIVTGGREQEALKLLEAVTHPSDFLMGDSQLLIYMANRRTPPPMGDLALVGIKAGRQTSDRMIRLTQKYQSPAVVQWSLRLPWLPEYLDWVEQNYLARRVWDNDHIIYFVQRVLADQPLPNPRQVRLGDTVALRGHQINPNSVVSGQDLTLKVYWQIDAPLDEDYTIFTQLLNSNGALVAGQDSRPLGGHFSTSRWPAGEIVTDVVHVSLPNDLPAGKYTLITGMYLLETLERLPVEGGPDNVVTLTTVEVTQVGTSE